MIRVPRAEGFWLVNPQDVVLVSVRPSWVGEAEWNVSIHLSSGAEVNAEGLTEDEARALGAAFEGPTWNGGAVIGTNLQPLDLGTIGCGSSGTVSKPSDIRDGYPFNPLGFPRTSDGTGSKP